MILELNPVTVSDHYEDYKKLFPISVNCEIQVNLRHRVLCKVRMDKYNSI